jgi:ATP-dependent Clp endopeptidase proteolytic subunit ClpP
MTDFPKFAPVQVPEDATFEEIKDALEFNNSVLSYTKSLVEAAELEDEKTLSRERRQIELEVARINLEEQRIKLLANEHRAGLGRGRFFLLDAVKDKTVDPLQKSIISWHEHADPSQELEFVINSPGGGVHDGFALFDTLRLVAADGRRVKTIATGYAASMGGILLQAGDKRVVTPNAWVMVHEVSTVAWGKSHELRDEVEFIDRLEDQIIAIFMERCSLPEGEFRKRWGRRDWWVSPSEALNLGIADVIGYS